MARKRVTGDQLATIVANGFQALQKEMREGFRRVTVRLDEHSHRLDRIERKLDNAIERVDDHSVRLVHLEKQRRA